MNTLKTADIDKIRSSTRTIVRELGFMKMTLAGTNLSPSAVHAIIEIGNCHNVAAHNLCQTLKLEKSSISRLIRNLTEKKLIENRQSSFDARVSILKLTDSGSVLFKQIEAFGREQVRSALSSLDQHNQMLIKNSLNIYSRALLGPDNTIPKIEIKSGYFPSLIGQVVAMHAKFYNHSFDFDDVFETKVAAEMAEFVRRLKNPNNQIWSALIDGNVVGSISVDGEDLGKGIAHLRWFIVNDGMRGFGIGQRLLEKVIRYVDKQYFRETHLWTFKGLEVARKLYERFDFHLVEEVEGETWGTNVSEQKFCRRKK